MGKNLSRSPYKRNRENNSKLSTSRDPGTLGRPGTPGSYKQALNKPKNIVSKNEHFLAHFSAAPDND